MTYQQGSRAAQTRARIRTHAQRGASIIESLIAFGLFASAAMAVFPVYQAAKRQSKFGDSKQLCQNVVQGKLDQYRFGRVTRLQDAVDGVRDFSDPDGNAVPRPDLGQLSLPSRAGNGTTGVQTAGGFTYAKLRYNRFFPASCRGRAQAKLFTNGATQATLASLGINDTLGMRECLAPYVASKDCAAADASCASRAWEDDGVRSCGESEDLRVAGELPGFKLYVKLELDTPWPLLQPPSGLPRFDNRCPDFGGGLYDFNGAGDAIRVTVTGVIDVVDPATDTPGRLGDQDASQNPAQFVCSASATIRPEQTAPVRYYLSTDGRIYPIAGNGLHGQADDGTGVGFAYSNVYRQTGVGAARQSSGILAFSVHPRNLSLYVLRPGSLTRYSDCSGQPVNCSIDAVARTGFSDAGAEGWPTVQEWRVPANIRGIGVDYRSGRVYGLTGDKTALLELTRTDGTLLPTCSGDCGATLDPLATVNATTLAAPPFTYLPPAGVTRALRFTGFFLEPSGDTAFVSDYASSAQYGSTSYTSSIYLAGDFSLLAPIAKLPVAGVSFSK